MTFQNTTLVCHLKKGVINYFSGIAKIQWSCNVLNFHVQLELLLHIQCRDNFVEKTFPANQRLIYVFKHYLSTYGQGRRPIFIFGLNCCDGLRKWRALQWELPRAWGQKRNLKLSVCPSLLYQKYSSLSHSCTILICLLQSVNL